MKLLVVDGLAETRKLYGERIKGLVPNVEVLESTSAEDALFVLLESHVDLIICSEVLSFRSAFDLVALLNHLKIKIPTIVMANDANNAIEAIRSNVFDFLVQPVDDQQLATSVQNALIHLGKHIERNEEEQHPAPEKIRLSTNSGYQVLDLEHVAYFKADGSYTTIFLKDGKTVYSSYYLGKIEKLVSDYYFLRVNRAVIINIKLIKLIDKRNERCLIEYDGKVKEFKLTRQQLKKFEENQLL